MLQFIDILPYERQCKQAKYQFGSFGWCLIVMYRLLFAFHSFSVFTIYSCWLFTFQLVAHKFLHLFWFWLLLFFFGIQRYTLKSPGMCVLYEIYAQKWLSFVHSSMLLFVALYCVAICHKKYFFGFIFVWFEFVWFFRFLHFSCIMFYSYMRVFNWIRIFCVTGALHVWTMNERRREKKLRFVYVISIHILIISENCQQNTHIHTVSNRL